MTRLPRKETDTTMYNRSIILNGTNMYDLWVKKWQRSTVWESEFDYPWWNIYDSNKMENLPSVASLATTK
jgi:hypothetical protein